MPIVNYVREHIRFIEYATDEHLSSSERLLWYALMHIANQRAQGNIWPDEFIRISNDRLLSYCPMKIDTLASARNSLKQRGLIEFIPGEKNKKSPAYRMVYFYPQHVKSETEKDGMESNTENSYYSGGNSGYNTGYNNGGNMGGNHGDYMGYIYNKHIPIPNPNPNQAHTESREEEDDMVAQARAETAQAWIHSFGKPASPGILDLMARKRVACGFEEGIIGSAIQLASTKCAASPVDYILTLLQDWYSCGIKSTFDLDRYMAIQDFDKGLGKNLHSSCEKDRLISEFREEMKGKATRKAPDRDYEE